MHKFDTIDYLKNGTAIQYRIYSILNKSRIFNILNDFTPVLAGTFPLGINVDDSDLDIICYVKNRPKFLQTIKLHFSCYDKFDIKELANGTIICHFFFMDFEIEIFGQDKPVKEQNAYIHMLNEYKLLQKHGETFRRKIIELKRNGLKTEPAFAQLLCLEGDPYKALLNISD